MAFTPKNGVRFIENIWLKELLKDFRYITLLSLISFNYLLELKTYFVAKANSIDFLKYFNLAIRYLY